ncbi:unnamed protein product [Brassica oleracea]
MMFARCCLLPPPFISAVRTRCFASETSDTGLLFREKLIYLQDLNVDPHKALRVNPSLRAAPISSVVSVETLLSSIGLSRPAVGRILDMFPDLLTSDPESDILPVLRFLSDEIYLSDEDIPKSITRCPRLLISSVDFQLRPALAFLKTLGFVGRDTVTSRNTVLLVSSVERTLIPKIEFLEEGLGFTRDEVAKMVVRSPALLTYSVENNLAPKVEFFMEEMRGDVKELKRFPQYFSFSLERKIKPRHRLLKEHGILMPLSEMLKVMSDEIGTVLGLDVCTFLSNLDAGTVLVSKFVHSSSVLTLVRSLVYVHSLSVLMLMRYLVLMSAHSTFAHHQPILTLERSLVSMSAHHHPISTLVRSLVSTSAHH